MAEFQGSTSRGGRTSVLGWGDLLKSNDCNLFELTNELIVWGDQLVEAIRPVKVVLRNLRRDNRLAIDKRHDLKVVSRCFANDRHDRIY